MEQHTISQRLKMKYEKEVKIIIKKHFKNQEINYIKEFSEGYNNVAYDVKINSKLYVIKILQLKDMEKFVLKQEIIRKLLKNKFKNYPIPKIIIQDFTKKIINKPFIIAEQIEGNSFLEKYKEVTNKEEVFEEIGELYGKLHTIRFKKFGDLDEKLKPFKIYSNWFEHINEYVEKIFDKIKTKKIVPKEFIKKCEEYFNNKKHILKKENEPVLIHGDSSLSNILVKKEKNKFVVSGLIDFEFSRVETKTKDLFKGIRTFDKKWKYKENIIKGYLKYNTISNSWKELALFYNFIENLKQIQRIPQSRWRNLNEEETKIRRKQLIEKSMKIIIKRIKD